MIYTTVILLVLTGAFRQISDMSQEGKLNHWGGWWHNESWGNKYSVESLMEWTAGGGELRPKFFGSTTFLVFVTDAKHFFAFLATGCYQTIIAIFLTSVNDLQWYWGLVIFLVMKSFVGTCGEITRRIIK